MFKVRFHLGAGEHFMHWQVKRGDEVSYFKPENHILYMYDCKLHNQRKIAEEICNGANKTVCAWIDCKNISIQPKDEFSLNRLRNLFQPISYNPRKVPYWTNTNSDNIDGNYYARIITDERKLLACE